MQTLHQIAPLRAQVAQWRRAGLRVGLVPTMGNLHAGHLALVEAALSRADRVVTTVFVNPMQFGAGEDFTAYPRTLDEDARLLNEAGNHCLFAPSEAEVYPRGRDGHTVVEVPALSSLLCGASRPGHFGGVATVVAKLFNMVQPDLAVFGEKDFQQLLVIRRMTEDLNLPVEIVGHPIVREADGLALSSRNAYLSPQERATAPLLQATLQQVAQRLRAGESSSDAEWDAARSLSAASFRPDYISVRRRADLAHPAPQDRALVVLGAAWLGKARLIDNLTLDLPG
ncbi:pantoate--beta-alanine ligase [Thiohalocapsa marina]|uniref:Pantothenate synthetase n=1 Tax=Thiohalocapsa marina TaxID=424902 RepID=A0A5M8FJT1_9GAMM|nr:pantoate--beta-alanine ligase [Thiohalocapsa marina]KAA6185158.1 pantoate--beta-alanine ligase [Thiohalocapsa marina]